MDKVYHLSKENQIEVLKVFWNEYAKGTSGQISPAMISNTLIPMVYSHGHADINLGHELVSIVLDKM